MTDSPAVQAAREAYRDACVAYMEMHLGPEMKFPTCTDIGQYSDEANAVLRSHAALQRALAAQQQQGQDEEAVDVMCRAGFDRASCRVLLSALKGEGFEVRKKQG